MDQKLLFLINRQWTNEALDWFMAAISSFTAWSPVFFVLFLVFFLCGDFRMRACLITAGCILGVNDGLIARPLKHAVNRPRPHQVLDGVRQVDLAPARPRLLALFRGAKVNPSRAAEGLIEGRSFPSGHTVNCFSIAMVALCFYGRGAWWVWVIAALVGYSRIYNGAHWPSDVVTSIFLASGATLPQVAGAELLWQRAGRRVLPRIHARHPSLLAR